MTSDLEGLIAVVSFIIPALLLTAYFLYDQNKIKRERKEKKS